MISRRDKLLVHPWEERHYKQHRERVESAKAIVDRSPPTLYPHIIQKAKKQQLEKERILSVETENIRLLLCLGNIMRTKRMSDFWREPRPDFLRREKLFEIKPRAVNSNWIPLENLKDAVHKASNGVRSNRCSSCKGQPERPRIIIPEERVPWQPCRLPYSKKYNP